MNTIYLVGNVYPQHILLMAKAIQLRELKSSNIFIQREDHSEDVRRMLEGQNRRFKSNKVSIERRRSEAVKLIKF